MKGLPLGSGSPVLLHSGVDDHAAIWPYGHSFEHSNASWWKSSKVEK
jgi:hypothetical protein